jgi:hypothetical protein
MAYSGYELYQQLHHVMLVVVYVLDVVYETSLKMDSISLMKHYHNRGRDIIYMGAGGGGTEAEGGKIYLASK